MNVGHARIYGVEVSTAGKVDIKKDMNLTYGIGYTFIEPEDLDNAKRIEEEKTYTDPLQMKNKSNDSKYLKYRNKHSFKASIDYTYKWFSIGTNLSYRSKVLAVDSVRFKEHVEVQFLINNLLNAEYSYRPMAVAPPRTFVCRMNLTF